MTLFNASGVSLMIDLNLLVLLLILSFVGVLITLSGGLQLICRVQR